MLGKKHPLCSFPLRIRASVPEVPESGCDLCVCESVGVGGSVTGLEKGLESVTPCEREEPRKQKSNKTKAGSQELKDSTDWSKPQARAHRTPHQGLGFMLRMLENRKAVFMCFTVLHKSLNIHCQF